MEVEAYPYYSSTTLPTARNQFVKAEPPVAILGHKRNLKMETTSEAGGSWVPDGRGILD